MLLFRSAPAITLATLSAILTGCGLTFLQEGLDDAAGAAASGGGGGSTTGQSAGGGETAGAGGEKTCAGWPDSPTAHCTDGAAKVACPEDPLDFAWGQDGCYRIDAPDWVGSDDTVLDAVTGLEWERYPPDAPRSFAQAGAYCDDLALGGSSDWRLPSRLELTSLVDYGRHDPSLDPVAFPAALEETFRTSTPYIGAGHWTVQFVTGEPKMFPDDDALHVRCVRGSLPSASFVVSDAGGVVTDGRTCRQWQRESVKKDWFDALVHCEELVFEGRDDWRLPNMKEVLTIVDETRSAPAIDEGAFGITENATFWTGTPTEFASLPHAWGIDFDFGLAEYAGGPIQAGTGASWHVRCVR